MEDADIVAVAARSLDDAKEFADQYDIPKTYEGYDALFADPDIDAIYISTPHTFHFAHTKAALEAGKHVLCEKPFTVGAAECQALIDLAREKQLFLMEALWTYFLPAIRKALQWLNEGRIGELKHVKGDFGYPIPYNPDSREWNVELAGGVLLEMGIYPVSFNWLFNPRKDYTMSVVGRRADNGADRDVTILFDYGDRDAVLNTSFDCRLPNWGFLVGTEGYIAIPDFFRASECQLHVLDDCIDHFKDNRQGSGFEFQIEAACKAIINGQVECEQVPHQTSLHFQQQMEAILKLV